MEEEVAAEGEMTNPPVFWVDCFSLRRLTERRAAEELIQEEDEEDEETTNPRDLWMD